MVVTLPYGETAVFHIIGVVLPRPESPHSVPHNLTDRPHSRENLRDSPRAPLNVTQLEPIRGREHVRNRRVFVLVDVVDDKLRVELGTARRGVDVGGILRVDQIGDVASKILINLPRLQGSVCGIKMVDVREIINGECIVHCPKSRRN